MATLNRAEARADFIRYELAPGASPEAIAKLWDAYTSRMVENSELPISALVWPAPTLTKADSPGAKPKRKPTPAPKREPAPKRKRKQAREPGTAIVVAPPADAIPVVSYRRQAQTARQMRLASIR